MNRELAKLTTFAKWLIAIWLAFLGTLIASVAMGAEIIGPQEPIETRQYAWLEITGLTDADSAMFLPSPELSVDGRKMQPNCGLFWATKTGRFTITAVITTVEVDWEAKRFRISTVPLQHTVVVEGEPDPPDPPLPPVVNPFPRPGDDWIETLRPIARSRLGPTEAKTLYDFCQSLKASIMSGKILTTADLHDAVRDGPANLPAGDRTEYKAAILKFAKEEVGRDERQVDVKKAEYLLDYLSWATWEAGHHE